MTLSNAAGRAPTAEVFMKSRLHSTRQNGRAAQRYIEPASRYTAGHFGDGQSIALQTTNLCDKLEQVVGVMVATGRITAWLCPVALAAECTEKQSTSRTTAQHNELLIKYYIFVNVRLHFAASCTTGCTKWFKYSGALKTQVGPTGKRKYTEKASTKQRISQGWKTQVRKMQVQCKPSVRQKKFGTSQVRVVHFQVGWESGLQIVFFLR